MKITQYCYTIRASVRPLFRKGSKINQHQSKTSKQLQKQVKNNNKNTTCLDLGALEQSFLQYQNAITNFISTYCSRLKVCEEFGEITRDS